MNSKKSKQCKDAKRGFKTKTHTKDGEAEVFVLPPDLLQKLGINLESVGTVQEHQDDITCMTDSHDHSDRPDNGCNRLVGRSPAIEGNEFSRASTILETADLMKKSVFLSPTFVTTGNNFEAGEIEISNNTEPNKVIKKTTLTNVTIEDVAAVENILQINKLPVILDSQLNKLEITNGQKTLNIGPDELDTVNTIELRNIRERATLCSDTYTMASTHNISEQVIDAISDYHSQSDKLPITLDHKANGIEIIENQGTFNQNSDIERHNIPDSKCVSLLRQNNNHIATIETSVTDIVDKPVRTISIDDHLDEAYLSDCSNSNLGPSEVTENLNSVPQIHAFDFNASIKCKNDIQIISQEVLSPSRLKDLQIMLSPKRSNYVPISKNDILTSKKFSDHIQYEIDTITDMINMDSFQTCSSPAKVNSEMTVNKEHTYLKNILLYDDKGNLISFDKNKINAGVISPETETNVIKDTEMKDLSQISKRDAIHKLTELDIKTPETNLAVIDLNVNDVEMEENEDILEMFVNELTSDDDNRILEKIEQSEKYDLPKPINDKGVGVNLECIQSEIISKAENAKKKKVNNCLPRTGFSTTSNNVNDLELEPNTIQSQQKVINYVSSIVSQLNDDKCIMEGKPIKIISEKITCENEEETLNSQKNINYNTNGKRGKLCNQFGLVNRVKVPNFELESIDDVLSSVENAPIDKEKRNKKSAHIDKEFDGKASIDKVKQIAMYLCEYAKNNSGTKKNRRNFGSSFEIPTKQPNQNPLTSKAYIQGVEKPGGSQKPDEKCRINKVLKTYTRAVKSHPVSTILPATVCAKKDLQILSVDHEQEDDNIILAKASSEVKFCLCSDFGRFAYYDCDFSYEHIHFWEHGGIKCCREDIFSIYHDTSSINDNFECKEDLDLSEVENTNADTFERSICWHACKENFLGKQDIAALNVLINHQTNEAQIVSNMRRENYQKEVTRHDSSSNGSDNSQQSNSDTNESASGAVGFNSMKSSTSQQTSVNTVVDNPTPVQNICNQTTCQESSHKVYTHEKVSVDLIVKPKIGTMSTKSDLRKQKSSKADTKGSELKMKNNDDSTKKIANITTPVKSDLKQYNRKCKPIVDNNENESNAAVENFTMNVNAHVTAVMSTHDVSERMTREIPDNSLSEKVSVSKQIDGSKRVDKEQNAVAEGSMQSVNYVVPKESKVADEGIRSRKKRKKSQKRLVIDDEDVKDEPASKKSVKCGVCKILLSETEWEDHVSEEHCYIAWRSGSSLDFKDPQLFKKLQDKAKSMDKPKLRCTFCSAELIQPKRFLTHVEKCFLKLEDLQEKEIDDNTEKIETIAEQTVDGETQPDVSESVSSDEDRSKCGICHEIVATVDWIKHITQKHEYLAWKDGEPPLNLEDDEEIRQHLFNVVREVQKLTCSKCGLARKYPKSYMQHVRNCTGESNFPGESFNLSNSDLNITVEDVMPRNPNDNVKCGVCSENTLESDWLQHIEEKHAYFAWREGELPLNTDDEESVKTHLYNISKEKGGLTCNKCGLVRKYVKTYLQHLDSCTGPKTLESETEKAPFINPLLKNSNVVSYKAPFRVKAEKNIAKDESSSSTSMVKCGVCHKEVHSGKWTQHIGRAHDYMAWREGESLDVNDEEAVCSYLFEIIKQEGYILCYRCGTLRKNPKSFLHHAAGCDKEVQSGYDESTETQETDGSLVCAVCSEQVEANKWKIHKMEKHYNIAWTVGSVPVDYKQPNMIDSLLKEYVEKYKKMVCHICQVTRVSRMGFYAHIIACGKTEEELDVHKNTCNICKKKYLGIYHNQHMAWHTQQEISREKKLRNEEEQLAKQMTPTQETDVKEETPGRRRAAQKARNIMQKLKSEQFQYSCPNCKFSGDSKEELDSHVCKKKDDEDYSESDESVKLENESSEETDDTIEGASGISDEECEQTGKKRKKKKYPAYTQVQRFPFVPKMLDKFLTHTGAEFCKQHFVNESLFPDLRNFDCEPVPSEELQKYLPPLEESCKVQFCDNTWRTLKRFEALEKISNSKLTSVSSVCIFTGGCIERVSWSPAYPEVAGGAGGAAGAGGDSYLAVAAHRAADLPRLLPTDTPHHPALIQLWHFGHFTQVAEMVWGLAHDFGTVWAMDWCPSGSRDELPEEPVSDKVLRLGLLAVAFSSGIACIFSIPYPSTLAKCDQVIHKLKPIVELRLTMNPERKVYQATSLCWSTQKPYDTIIVGYSDGATAYYDINTESPFLRTVKDGVTVIYPYHDERVHSSCVTGVSTYPHCGAEAWGAGGAGGAACSASATGAALVARPGVRPARQACSAALAGLAFQPLWPSAALCGDEANMTTSLNELEWYGGGRRMGGARAAAGCARCGALVLAALPLLRARHVHPAATHAAKQVVGIVQMTSLSNKRRRLANDELQTKIEPTTYEEAIQKYGIEFKIDKDTIHKAESKSRENYPERHPERFPLNDVTSLAFCPEPKYHRRLAVATHSGLLFVMST